MVEVTFHDFYHYHGELVSGSLAPPDGQWCLDDAAEGVEEVEQDGLDVQVLVYEMRQQYLR